MITQYGSQLTGTTYPYTGYCYTPNYSYPSYTVPPQPTAQQQSPATTQVNARYISDISEITPNEVPMDNSYKYFVKADGSEIYAKTWSQDGTMIITRKYIEEPQITITTSEDNNQNSEILESLMEKLDRIEKKVNKLQYSNAKPQQKRRINDGD